MQGKLTQDIPPLLNNLVGKKCAFHIKINSFNQGGRAGYTVTRLSELLDSPPNIRTPAPATEASPSKKTKTTWGATFIYAQTKISSNQIM